MGARGPAPKPVFALVREGNPGHQKIPASVMLTPEDPDEPDWQEAFPTVEDLPAQAVNRRAREVARREWRRVAPVLVKSMGLAEVDQQLLRDYCVCVARIDQCERDISTRGMLLAGAMGGVVKNPSTTVVSQYRAQLKTYIRELGLSPSSRASIPPPKGGDDDDGGDPFD